MKKVLKKIVALICVMTMCVGLVPATASAVDSYTGKLTIAGSLAPSSESTSFYIKGTDDYAVGADWGDITMMPAENDAESGIYINGTRIDTYYSAGANPTSVRLRKIYDSSKQYYIEKIPTVNTGDVLTIKGTFYVDDSWLDASVSYDSTPIVFEASHFLWNGSQWVDCYSGELAIEGSLATSSESTSFYIKGTDDYAVGADWGDITMMPAENDTESGIFINGTRIDTYYSAGANPTSVRLRKIYDSSKQYYIEKIPTVNTGDVLTIKGIFYVDDSWLDASVSYDSTPLVFLKSSFQWNGSQWVDYVPETVYNGKLTIAGAEVTNNTNLTSFYIKGTDAYATNTDWPESTMVPNEDDADSGIFVDGVRIETYFNVNNSSSVRLRKYNDANCYYYIQNIPNVETGSVVTIKGTFYTYGNWMETDQFDSAAITFEESKFQWNGSQWVDYVEIINYPGELTYTTRGGSATNVYLDTTDTMPTISWEQQLKALNDDSGIYVNGTRMPDALLKRVDTAAYFVENFGTLNAGDVLKIKGLFGYSTNNETVTFAEAQFQWTGSAWKNYVELASYSGSLTTIGAESTTNQNLLYLKGNDEYLKDSTEAWTGLPEEKLVAESADANSGIWLNDTKQENAFMKKYAGSKNLYIAEGFSTPATGDIVKIVGTFYSQDGLSKVTYEEGKFMWSGTNWIDYVESSEYAATEVAINGLYYTGIMYDEANGQWKMYFTLSNTIPGDANDTYYPYMIYSVNGTEYITHLTKSTYTVDGTAYDSLYLNIPSKVLPQTLAEDTEYTITLKAGSSQGRNNSADTARGDGIRLNKDFSFVVGTSHESFAPAIDYVTAGGGTANGIYLSTTDTFPTTGWDAQLKKVGENSGIYKYNASTDTYVETEVFIKKYADNKYYVCLSDVSESAEEGTIVMLKGTFTFAGLHEVTFKTAKYIYTGEAWKTYTATADTEEDVEWYGDATGDATAAEDINSIDLVRIMRYLAQEEEEIQAANADLNSSGNIDEHDENMMRWLLVNGTTYFVNGSNIKGAPSYADTLEMRLAAYISPDLTGDFQLYKDAGFTTLMGEGTGRAIYGNAGLNSDGLDAYMQKAKQYDLDVLVVSSAIQDMLAGTLDVNPTTIENAYKDLSDTYGDTFRGFFMLDEPKYSQLESHTNVLNVLNSLNAEQGKEIFTSFLPTYTDDDSVLWNDTSLSLNEKYSKYAEAYGNLFGEFVYDFYPFKHKTTGTLFWQREEDSVRQDWFNNLELSAKTGHGNFETGITVQSYAENLNRKDYYRDVTEADISFQVYSALAYGMKSIQYFTYDKHWDETVGTTNSMIFNGQKTAIYDAVKTVNAEIKAIDHILLNYNWQGTIGISVDDEDNIMDSVATYTSPRISSYSATNDAIIGCLKDVNGYDGFMLVHVTDPAENKGSINMSVTFNNATHAKVYIDGVESTVALTNGQYSATLTPGQGIFVIPYIAE